MKSKRAMITRVPIHRALVIREQVARGMKREQLVNCSDLAEELEVNRKTVLRDIEWMRDDMNLPIEYDPARHGYFFTRPVDDLPLFRLSKGELLALFVAEKALAPLAGTAFGRRVADGLRKLSAQMGDEVSVQWAELDEALSMQAGAVAVADAEVFESLTKAVQVRRVVGFEYKKLGASRYSKREVEPLHVGYIDGQWYLFAWDLKRDGERTFALSRVRSVQLSRRKVNAGRTFSIRDRLQGSFGVFSSSKKGRSQRVRIRFDAFAAQLVREREWHESQVVQELAEGGIELEMRLGSLHEVERWVLSWGEHAEVLAPKKLRARVLEIAHRIVARQR